ncbi:MBL fold metallo-hydrolase [soil metagenome]|nr:MBL fold metallo-hydrolase [Actinomycetota bacterium]MDQ3533816.1 MBL fold metallo-hydrolase [Actinomycetota bacterium]
MAHHYEGDDLIIRKIEVGDMGNNVYVLEDPDTHEALIVDGCFEADTILSAVGDARVVGIVQTHGHPDHIQALADLKGKLGVPVYAHPGDAYPVEIENRLSDGDSVPFGTKEAKVLHTPGHTPGGTSFLVGRHLIAGDTLFPGGPGKTENKAEFDQVITSLETKLFTLPDDTPVYPGHGDDTTIGTEKPHLEEWVARGW